MDVLIQSVSLFLSAFICFFFSEFNQLIFLETNYATMPWKCIVSKQHPNASHGLVCVHCIRVYKTLYRRDFNVPYSA